MKAGVGAAVHGLGTLDDVKGVARLLTSDEERGSGTSSALIEETARGLEAVFVVELSEHGALKTGRQGRVAIPVGVEGQASHVGLNPKRGTTR